MYRFANFKKLLHLNVFLFVVLCLPLSSVRAEKIIDINGTTWVGSGLVPNVSGEITFMTNGGTDTVYSNNNSNPTHYTNGTWKQAGNIIYFESSNKYAEFNGVLNGEVMSGTAKNVNGVEWTWSFRRQVDLPLTYLSENKNPTIITQSSRGWIGVTFGEVTKAMAQNLGLTYPRGAFIQKVEPGGPAAVAGVESGDVILNFNGQEIVKSIDLSKSVGENKPGTNVFFQIWRKGAPKYLTVIVSETQALPGTNKAPDSPPPIEKPSVKPGLRESAEADKRKKCIRLGLTPGSDDFKLCVSSY